MTPNLSGWSLVARMFAGAGIVYVAATLAAGAPDVLCLVGVMTYVTGMTG